MRESWKHIPGTRGRYSASTHGRVKSNDWNLVNSRGHRRTYLGRVLTPRINNDGYGNVLIYGPAGGDRRTAQVHRLVCEAFHGTPPAGMQAAHLDGDPLNNRPENLKWCTPKENCSHMEAHGTRVRGFGVHTAVLTEACVHIIRAMCRSGNYTQSEIAEKFGVSQSSISHISTGVTWSHLPGALK